MGARVADHGVGSTLAFSQLDAGKLQAAMRVALDDDTVKRARELGHRMSSGHNAAARSVDAIEDWLGSSHTG